jgi:hypothetical protein
MKLRLTHFTLAAALGLTLAAAGCHKTPPDAAADAQSGPDPADVNMAPVETAAATQPTGIQPARVLGQRAQNDTQQSAEDYSQQAAPIERRTPQDDSQSYAADTQADPYAADVTAEEAPQPPPPLPVYEQPPAPDPNYLWTPGYWGYANAGYYWVPGAWTAAPYTGALWTPGYWGGYGSGYRFHRGFWGLHIGFYGGIDYGFGYTGHGYDGGYWRNNNFYYNQAVNRVNVNIIHNTYTRNVVVHNTTIDRVSYNGGRGGIQARPGPAEIVVLHEQRTPPMAAQLQVQHEAEQNRQQFFNENKGHPAVVVAAHPVAADRTLPAPLPRREVPVVAPAGQAVHPAQAAGPMHPQPQPGQALHNGPENRPAQLRPQPPHVVTPENRPTPAPHPATPPQPERPAAPAAPQHPVQPRPTPQPVAPVQPHPTPQPEQRDRPNNRPAPEARPIPPAGAPEAHPAPAPRAQPTPHAAAPAPAPHPEPRPEAHPDPREEGHPK